MTNNSIKINTLINGKNWLTNSKTFIQQKQRKKAEDFFDLDSDTELNYNSESYSNISDNKNEINYISPPKEKVINPFSFVTYNSFISRKEKKKYMNNYLYQKIKLSLNDPIVPTFQFFPLDNSSVYKYESFDAKEIPIYQRTISNKIKGIKNDKVSELILNDTNYKNKQCINYFKDSEKELTSYLSHKRYFNRPIIKDNINRLLFIKEEEKGNIKDAYKKIKLNEQNANYWVDYIKLNIRNKQKLIIIFEKITSIKLDKDNLDLLLYQLRFSEVNNEQYKKVIDKYQIYLISKTLSEKDKLIFTNEYLSYIKRNMMKSTEITITDIQKIYSSLCNFLYTNNQYFFYQLALFEYISFLFSLKQYSIGMSILIVLIETSVLNIKKIKYKDDYIKYFNSPFPKLCDFNNKCGYLFFLSENDCNKVNLNAESDFIDKFEDNDAISYRAYNSLYDSNINHERNSKAHCAVNYNDISNFVFPLTKANDMRNILKLLLDISINWSQIENYNNETGKFTFDFNSNLFCYLNRLSDFMIEINEISTDVYLFKLNLFMMNQKIKVNDKFNTYSKNIFKIKENQNNIPLYCEFLIWGTYYEKYDLCDNIIKLLKKKTINNERNYLGIVHLYEIWYKLVKCLHNKITYHQLISDLSSINEKEITSNQIRQLILVLLRHNCDIDNLLTKSLNKNQIVLILGNVFHILYLNEPKYSFHKYKDDLLQLKQLLDNKLLYEIEDNITFSISNQLISVITQFNYEIIVSQYFRSFSLYEMGLLVKYLKKKLPSNESVIYSYNKLYNRYQNFFYDKKIKPEKEKDIIIFLNQILKDVKNEEKFIEAKKDKILNYLFVNIYSKISYNIDIYEKGNIVLLNEFKKGIDNFHQCNLQIKT